MKQFNKYFWFLVPILLLMGCHDRATNTSKEGSVQATPVGKDKPLVQVVHPKDRNFTAEINIVGTAKPNKVVQVHARESGYIKSMKQDIGDRVREGEIIAELENPELFRKQEQYKSLMDARESIYNRLKRIAEKTPALTTIEEVETAKAEYESVRAEYNAVTDRIEFLEVKSPFDGIVTKRFVDRGALVQSGTKDPQAKPLVELMELEMIRVRVPLPESDVNSVSVGTDATVTFPELPGETFEGTVSRISRALNPDSKTMEIEIDIPNPDLEIKPGMYAKIDMSLSSQENVLSVPNVALKVIEDDFFVYVVEDGVVRRVSVRRGLRSKNYFEILNADIDTSSQIITRGKNLIKPGMSVNSKLKANNNE